jgi:hypothetical protein
VTQAAIRKVVADNQVRFGIPHHAYLAGWSSHHLPPFAL